MREPSGVNDGEPAKVDRASGENGGRSPDEERCIYGEEGRRRRRPRLRWEDCVKRDVRKAGTEGNCIQSSEWR